MKQSLPFAVTIPVSPIPDDIFITETVGKQRQSLANYIIRQTDGLFKILFKINPFMRFIQMLLTAF